MSHRHRSAIIAGIFCSALVIFGIASAQAMLITTTFDSTVTSRGDAASWISAWNYAAVQFQSLYSDSINVNIILKAGTGLGASSTSLVGTLNYANTKLALNLDATTATDATAYGNLPATDPTGGKSFWFSRAQAKALNLISNDLTNDGTVTLGGSNSYTFDPNNRAVAGEFDFIGVAEHEISEVMGRFGLLGATVGGGPAYSVLDLFGYSAPSTLDILSNQSGVYFSVDGGTTSLRIYNNGSNGGDNKDWASGQTPANDSFNAFTGTGTKNDMLSVADIASMDVIGYNAITPEPSSIGILATLGLLLARRRAH